MSLLAPDAVFHRITSITPEELRRRGLTALVLDIDNTLTAHDSQEVPPAVAQWLADRRAEGFRLAVSSNNSPARVRLFAERLGLEFVANAAKPFSKGFRRAEALFGVPKKEMAVVGDQLFTDVLGARLFGITALLVEPMYRDIKWYILLKRKLEAPVLRRYYRKGGVRYE